MSKHDIFIPPYDRPSDAWNHLRDYDPNPAGPRAPGDYPVMLIIRLSVNLINCKTFESFEAIQRFIPQLCVFQDHVICNLAHLRAKYTPGQVRQLYRKLTGVTLTAEQDPHKVQWDWFQAQPLIKMKAAASSANQNQYLFDLEKLGSTNRKFTKQLTLIIARLLADQRRAYGLDELRIFANNLPKHGLVTRQDPFRVLQFYLPQLHDAGFLEYPRKVFEKSGTIDNTNYGEDHDF